MDTQKNNGTEDSKAPAERLTSDLSAKLERNKTRSNLAPRQLMLLRPAFKTFKNSHKLFHKIKVCKTVVSVCMYKRERQIDWLIDKQIYVMNSAYVLEKFNLSISASLQISKMSSERQFRRVNALNRLYSWLVCGQLPDSMWSVRSFRNMNTRQKTR